jgi:hypothetical protein
MLLAAASVPSGIELREIDDLSSVRPDYDFDQTSKVPASELVTMFNTQHRDYAANIIDGVIVIRPADGRVSFLDQPSTIAGRIEVTGLLTAAKAVFVPLDPRMTGPAVSSMLGDVDRGENARIVLTGALKGKNVLNLLNDIVRRSDEWQNRQVRVLSRRRCYR